MQKSMLSYIQCSQFFFKVRDFFIWNISDFEVLVFSLLSFPQIKHSLTESTFFL